MYTSKSTFAKADRAGAIQNFNKLASPVARTEPAIAYGNSNDTGLAELEKLAAEQRRRAPWMTASKHSPRRTRIRRMPRSQRVNARKHMRGCLRPASGRWREFQLPASHECRQTAAFKVVGGPRRQGHRAEKRAKSCRLPSVRKRVGRPLAETQAAGARLAPAASLGLRMDDRIRTALANIAPLAFSRATPALMELANRLRQEQEFRPIADQVMRSLFECRRAKERKATDV